MLLLIHKKFNGPDLGGYIYPIYPRRYATGISMQNQHMVFSTTFHLGKEMRDALEKSLPTGTEDSRVVFNLPKRSFTDGMPWRLSCPQSLSMAIGVGAQSTLGGHEMFAQKICVKNSKMPQCYMILARKIIKIPQFLWYLLEKCTNSRILHDFCPKNARKFPVLIARKIFFREF